MPFLNHDYISTRPDCYQTAYQNFHYDYKGHLQNGSATLHGDPHTFLSEYYVIPSS